MRPELPGALATFFAASLAAVVGCSAAGDQTPNENAGTGGTGSATTGVGGALGATCPDGTLECNGACAQVETDNAHCGACDTRCASGASCADGECVCSGGQTSCGSSCVDTTSDVTNCGTCGTACGTGQVCQGGECACLAGLVECSGQCVDTNSSAAHCGACTVQCDAIQVCSKGTCAANCSTGETACDGACTDLSTDVRNCGSCGLECDAGLECAGGQCVCPSALTLCSGQCRDTSTDNANCGACGIACGGGRACSGGTCVCSTGQTWCSTACVRTQRDPANCGGCGVHCATGTTCVAGTCTGGTGGSDGTGGSTGGTGGTGGSTGGTGGSTGGTGGSTGGTGGGSACPGADPAEFAVVSGWLHGTVAPGAMPSYAYSFIGDHFPSGAAFDRLACSIAMSCVEFAPMENNWLRKCEAVVTSAIVAESSYNPTSVVVDSYSTRTVNGVTANDPTVGLLQIRFSSTVRDYNYNGPLAKMAAIGCDWPAALASHADDATWWATNGGTTYLSFMQDVACNVGLGSWYYFYNATGNGGQNPVWIYNYCAGQGVAGNMVVGLLSHLMGGSYPRPADANNPYPWGIECCADGNPSLSSCSGCTGRFAAFMGIATNAARPSPDPFLEQLVPEPSKYCK